MEIIAVKNKYVIWFAALAAKHYRIALTLAFALAFLRTADAFRVFLGHIDTFDTPEEWRFYLSLVSFLLFFSMAVFVVTTIVGMEIYRNHKK